ncbi:MAG: outer membrane beta-barrel protein [Prevotella sp.]|nr:outer membrane beta-barrel protein [Prevotella sp.]
MKKLFLAWISLFFLSPVSSWAQDDPEYRMEIGAGAGLMGYLGDFNGSLTKDLQPMATILARYNFDTYMGLKFNLSYGKMKGQSTDVETYYPAFDQEPYEFDNSLVDFSLTYEYNFWPYGTGRDYRGAKRLAPFLFGGIGGTFVSISGGEKKSVFSANVPIGIGLKYKMGERLNLGVEWAMHFSLSDELDGMKDPYGIKSTGAFKNTDCYSTLQLTLTYSFLAKCRTCHNEDE